MYSYTEPQGDPWHPVMLYDYQPNRAGKCASRFLKGFTGLLQRSAIYSIVETAKANGLRPFPYLKLPLERLPFGVPAQACLPRNDSVQLLCI